MNEKASRLTREIKGLSASGADQNYSRRLLETISRFVEEHGNIEEGLAALTVREGEDGLEIVTADGFLINDLLPSTTRIRYSNPERDEDEYGYDPLKDEMLIPRDFGESGLIGRVVFAHELGHLLHNKEVDISLRLGDAEQRRQDPNSPGYIQAVCDRYFNIQLENEVEAWNYGKAAADLFGVSEEVYEDCMHHYLITHFYERVQILSEELPVAFMVSSDVAVDLYDPFSQQTIMTSFTEIDAFLEKFEKDIDEGRRKSAEEVHQVLESIKSRLENK